LQLFVEEGDIGRHDRLLVVAQRLTEELAEIPGLSSRIIADPLQSGMPMVEVMVDERRAGFTTADLIRRLRRGSPAVEVNPWRPEQGLLLLSPACLAEDDPFLIGRRFKEVLAQKVAAQVS
jgi:seryl-tRNA(Sec) selenium transferase